ncbi:MAG: hypothetical protein ACO1OC_09790 [Tuberibacillus sp.]
MKIVPILGKVKFQITLDPSSWIFDDRKIAYQDYYDEAFNLDAFLEAQKDERAGAAIPRLAKLKRKYKKDEWLTESFVMPLKIFLQNAEPLQDAKEIVFERVNGEAVSFPLNEVDQGALQFSRDGKVLTDEGPLIYLSHDHSKPPVTQIKKISVI